MMKNLDFSFFFVEMTSRCYQNAAIEQIGQSVDYQNECGQRLLGASTEHQMAALNSRPIGVVAEFGVARTERK
jgi:hypothetical protein